jgi:predicted nucleotidyltransferase
MVREKKTGKKPIEQYDHKDKKRANNPPVGLVTPELILERKVFLITRKTVEQIKNYIRRKAILESAGPYYVQEWSGVSTGYSDGIKIGGGDLVKKIAFSKDKLEDFCRRHHIKKLSLYGSYLRGENQTDSDVDILVEFDPDHIPGLIRLAGMEIELLISWEEKRICGPPRTWVLISGRKFWKWPRCNMPKDDHILWKTVIEDLPPLIAELEKVLEGKNVQNDHWPPDH